MQMMVEKHIVDVRECVMPVNKTTPPRCADDLSHASSAQYPPSFEDRQKTAAAQRWREIEEYSGSLPTDILPPVLEEKNQHPHVMMNQFKPGQSGNPKGKPKGSKNFATVAKALLELPTDNKMLENIGPDGRRLQRLVTITQAQIKKAESGDTAAFIALRDTIDGKPKQAIDVTQKTAREEFEDELVAEMEIEGIIDHAPETTH